MGKPNPMVIPLGEIWKLQEPFASRRRAVHRPARSRWAKPEARPWRCLGPEVSRPGKGEKQLGKKLGKCWENGHHKSLKLSKMETKGPAEGLARLHFVEKWWGNRCEIKRKMTKQEECWKLNEWQWWKNAEHFGKLMDKMEKLSRISRFLVWKWWKKT